MTSIRIAHSPDADDAFMFAPLFSNKVDAEGLNFSETREDIESLNQKANESGDEGGGYEVTAVSLAAYPSIADRYYLLSTGACFGDKYGPLVVAAKDLKARQLLKVRMGIPGKFTTAFLLLRLYSQHLAGEGKPGLCYSTVPFDQIMDQVLQGKVDAGLIIHEGQLSYEEKGLRKIVDLGEWWHKEYKLPLPLGGIAVRRDLGVETCTKIGRVLRRSFAYAIEHTDEILAAALPYARGLDEERTKKFIGMYVNELTLSMGRKGFKAIKTLYDEGFRYGLTDQFFGLDECLLDVEKGKTRAEIFSFGEREAATAPQESSESRAEPMENESASQTPNLDEGTPLSHHE